jgi:hypothetical protein
MGCILCKSLFKYEKLDSYKTTQKRITSDKKYKYYIQTNKTPSYKYYHFIIKDKLTDTEIVKILLTLNAKPQFLSFKYDDIENILDITFTVKCMLDNSILYRDIDYRIKISSTGKYRLISYNNDCELDFFNDM